MEPQILVFAQAGTLRKCSYSPLSWSGHGTWWQPTDGVRCGRRNWWQPNDGSCRALGPPGLGTVRTKLTRDQRKRQLGRLQRMVALMGARCEGGESCMKAPAVTEGLDKRY